MKKRQFMGTAPFFHVKDVVAAAEFYRDVLGFDIPRYWGDPPCFCMPARDGLCVMLSQPKNSNDIRTNGAVEKDSWDAYFWVADADALFEQARKGGAEVVYEPTVQEYYGMKEFAIRDVDGYVLAFGEDVEES